jgi:hypothetical protein
MEVDDRAIRRIIKKIKAERIIMDFSSYWDAHADCPMMRPACQAVNLITLILQATASINVRG